ncbi:hypothetical protein TRFO_39214 [Tritrichomonas foetus]|uniref:Leucine Rich Repeat family protein n=1 Tax=Tritrichomonas foetus TaxID=1144522 RepID=A0A1J4JBF5_9EUKA|nr:hypothetical protein TRFO_39214 [Tritrichomonas foetus]|eukprot:OHS94580.1 hypothetical protein TRFO_39214 [Tritrichomonas foetus]
MSEEEEGDYYEDSKSALPHDQQLASDIFMRENVDGILDRGIGTFHAIEKFRRMNLGIPSMCTPHDLMFLISDVSSEGDFIEETFITFFCECLKLIRDAFQSRQEEEDFEQFALTKEFIQDRLSDLQPVEGEVFHFTFTSFCVMRAEITEISELANFDALLNISLKSNLISDISPLCKIPHLKNLVLTENKIKEIKDLNFPCLENLVLSQNQINCVVSIKAPKLKSLDLSQNRVFFMAPSAFYECKSLEKLNLSNNQINDIKESTFSGLTKLKALNISSNNLKFISYCMHKDLISVTDIDLSDNPLVSVQGLENLKSLNVCDLHKTLIEQPTELSPLSDLENFQYLYMYESPVCELEEFRPEAIHLLQHLEEIDEQPISFQERQDVEAYFRERCEMEANELFGGGQFGEEEEDEFQFTGINEGHEEIYNQDADDVVIGVG